MIQATCGSEVYIKARVAAAWKKWHDLEGVLWDRGQFIMLVVSILTTWIELAEIGDST